MAAPGDGHDPLVLYVDIQDVFTTNLQEHRRIEHPERHTWQQRIDAVALVATRLGQDEGALVRHLVPTDREGSTVPIFDVNVGFLFEQRSVLGAPGRRRVNREAWVVFERRLDAPEVIEMPMREYQEVN